MQQPLTSHPPETQPKRAAKYKRMTKDRKRDLIFRVLYLAESLKAVCQDLGFNISTGKNLLQRYKKTGEFVARKKVKTQTPIANSTKGLITKESENSHPRCPLGILLLGEDTLQIVSAKTYTPEEEVYLIGLHKEFVRKGIV